MADELMTVADVAASLELNQQRVRNWIDAGKLPTVRVGRRVKIKRSDFDQLVDGGYSATESAEEFIERKSRQWARERDHNRPFHTKDIGGQGRDWWIREKWTWQIQSNHRMKALVIERLRLDRVDGQKAYELGAKPGDVEYRFGYWIVGRNGKAHDRWWWGQSAPMIPQADLSALMAKARSDGTLTD